MLKTDRTRTQTAQVVTMNKTLIVVAILGLFLLAGCSGTTTVTSDKNVVANTAASADPVQEASNNLVNTSDNVQIGEMV